MSYWIFLPSKIAATGYVTSAKILILGCVVATDLGAGCSRWPECPPAYWPALWWRARYTACCCSRPGRCTRWIDPTPNLCWKPAEGSRCFRSGAGRQPRWPRGWVHIAAAALAGGWWAGSDQGGSPQMRGRSPPLCVLDQSPLKGRAGVSGSCFSLS